jgi:hypothetical protein
MAYDPICEIIIEGMYLFQKALLLFSRKELSNAEVSALIEEGRFFLACQLMKEDKHEKAIEAFQQLKSPYASFYQVCRCDITVKW